MKKILSIVLVVALAIGCFVGCGKDDKNNSDAQANSNNSVTGNEVKGDLTFSDISGAMSKMANGQEINIKLSITLKPVLDENYTEEDFIEESAGLVIKKGDGLFELPLSLSGVAGNKKANLTLKFADKNITDIIVVEEKVYVNGKAIFELISSFIPEEFEYEFAWPCANSYIEVKSFMEYIQEVNQQETESEDIYSDEFNDLEWSEVSADLNDDEWVEGDDYYIEEDYTVGYSIISGLDEESINQLKDVIEVISTAIPETTLKSLGKQVADILTNNNALTMDSDKISIKIDTKNLKGIVLAFVDLIRANGADVIDYVMQAIIKSDKIDEEMKTSMTTGYNKDDVKKDLENELDSAEIGKEIDETLPKMKDTHFYIDMSADENSAKFNLDILLDGLVSDETEEETSEFPEYEDESFELSQMGITLGIECKAKDVTVSAPASVLTEAEINTLLVVIASLFG
ncbi:MAG: hypothetical protein E7387_02910 [Ruminococcaceae bacterium]|nr:hypothetical protein [Oscillospiraceae bacterium]